LAGSKATIEMLRVALDDLDPSLPTAEGVNDAYQPLCRRLSVVARFSLSQMSVRYGTLPEHRRVSDRSFASRNVATFLAGHACFGESGRESDLGARLVALGEVTGVVYATSQSAGGESDLSALRNSAGGMLTDARNTFDHSMIHIVGSGHGPVVKGGAVASGVVHQQVSPCCSQDAMLWLWPRQYPAEARDAGGRVDVVTMGDSVFTGARAVVIVVSWRNLWLIRNEANSIDDAVAVTRNESALMPWSRTSERATCPIWAG
jgi:hypothetical protein